jgi:hypothetical protein
MRDLLYWPGSGLQPGQLPGLMILPNQYFSAVEKVPISYYPGIVSGRIFSIYFLSGGFLQTFFFTSQLFKATFPFASNEGC